MNIVITEVRNARSLQEDNQRFDVEINHPEHGWIPYHLTPHDTDMTIDNDALLELIGSDFAPYVPPTQEELDAKAAINARLTRNTLLRREVDPIVSNPLRWADLSSQEQSDVSAYRLALLDVPQQSGFPSTISWPNKPSCLP